MAQKFTWCTILCLAYFYVMTTFKINAPIWFSVLVGAVVGIVITIVHERRNKDMN